MAFKKLLFHSQAREKVVRGASILADAVRVTLGPKSKSVLIERKWGEPLVCNDGVTIAREVDLKDPEENLGARMIRSAAVRTGDMVGDGTSTATILAHAILSEGARNVVAGASAIDLKRGLDRGLRAAVGALRGLSRPVQSRKERTQIATISAHNDGTIGELVADAVERVGTDGVITVEESKTTETTLEVVEGMRFDRGYLSPYLVTDPERMEATLENVAILIHEKKLARLDDILPFLEQIVKAGQSLLIVAEDIEGEALAALVVNKIRGVLRVVAVKAPGFGDRRKAMLEDLAILTGGKVIAEELGVKLENVGLADLGRARKVVVTKDSTTIIEGAGKTADLAARVAQLRSQIKDVTSDYEREQLQQRLARLSGGVAVIRAGAPSEVEMRARKEALDDAINSTKAATAEGIVPGGGLALLRAIEAVQVLAAGAEGDERTGLLILKHALEAPARQIGENSGVDAGVVVERMRAGAGSFGYDAANNRYVDLYEAGIIDPTKVVRVALENAVSVASVLLLTEATMTELPEPKAPAPAISPEE